MKIRRVEIENFRAVSNFKEEIGSYTAFIGYNGGGKSSILHAVRWFFEGFDLQPTDVYSGTKHDHDSVESTTVKVTISFDDLSSLDRQNFKPYVIGDEITLTRAGGVEKKSKLYGKRLICKEFSAIREESKIQNKRTLAIQLMEEFERFSNLNISPKSNKGEIEDALKAWESNPDNEIFLSSINDEDANHFFGAVGSNKLKINSGFVFIPAAPDLTGQFDVSGKGSALQLLLGDILKGVVTTSINKWTEENATILKQLETTVREEAATQLKQREGRVNRYLKDYLPGVNVEFEVGLEDWIPKANPSAESKMRQGDREFVIEREGHGVQRATLLALLQATADARVKSAAAHDDPSDGKGIASIEDEGSLIVFIEEPEVYQHPVQARMMARSFANAALNGNVQFVLATHSPYFLEASQIEYTFRVENLSPGLKVSRPELNGLLRKKFDAGELDKYFLESVVESLFSRAALVVEGDTDRAIFDTIPCDCNGLTLKDVGISIAVAGGSNSLLDMARLIQAFGVPTYIVRDGDSDRQTAIESIKIKRHASMGHEEFCQKLDTKVEQKLNSWKSAVEKFVANLQELELDHGFKDFQWGQGACIGRYAGILYHDLEYELNEWQSFGKEAANFSLSEDYRDTKKAGIYARVAAHAKYEDLPNSLKKITSAVRLLADG